MKIEMRFQVSKEVVKGFVVNDASYFIIPGFRENEIIVVYNDKLKRGDYECLYYISFEPSEMKMMKTEVGKDMILKRIIEAIMNEEEDAKEEEKLKVDKRVHEIQMYKRKEK